MSINALSSSAPLSKPNRFLYNGKELQDDFDFNTYNYGARMYDPMLGRFFSPDPLADEFVAHSPYSYSFNNPIYFTDPDGRKPVPGPFTGRGWRDGSMIHVYRLTPEQKFMMVIVKETAYAATGWFGVAAGAGEGLYHASNNNATARDAVNAINPTLGKATQKALDNFSEWYNGPTERRYPAGKYNPMHFRGFNNLVMRPLTTTMGFMGFGFAVADYLDGPTAMERMEGLTLELGDQLISGANINISQPGMLDVQRDDATVSGVESQLNVIHLGLTIFLQDFDLSTKKGYSEAQAYIKKNRRYLDHFIQLLWQSTQANDDEDDDDNE